MVTFSADDMKIVADILAEITDEDVTATPPPPLEMVPPPATRATSVGTSVECSRRYNVPQVIYPHPTGQPGLNIFIQPRNSMRTPPLPTTSHRLSTPDLIKEDSLPSQMKVSSRKRTTTKKQATKRKSPTFLKDLTADIYRYLNKFGEACLDDDSFNRSLGYPDERRIYDAARWLEGFGLIAREKFKRTESRGQRTMIYLIFEDGSTLRSVRKEIDHLDQGMKLKEGKK